ncbi:HigA family addiction module antitoxin [Desulfonatronum thioautotrophicum]|uniref:HigA family addiction module antitoxin n=1 Tax=Desulfonatronum thioautotrophicum TaxID=617001 RepID=UPI0005EB69B8|nr:HigA family addiction module antitoxin [Desulfonatronum thioautotrophicum]
MPIPNTTPRTIAPTHPGEMLREDFMPDYELSPTSLATSLGVTRQTINELIRCRRAVTPLMALRLSRLFGNSPRFWLNAQQAVDLWDLEAAYRDKLEAIPRLGAVKDEATALA